MMLICPCYFYYIVFGSDLVLFYSHNVTGAVGDMSENPLGGNPNRNLITMAGFDSHSVQILAVVFIVQVWGHGMLLEPPNRSSLWRFPERFGAYKPRVNYNDNELFCGGFPAQYEVNGGRCGVCGDPWNEPEPRENEDGGIYGRGIVAGRYRAGQVVDILVHITRSHRGYFRLRLCARNSTDVPATQTCFDENRLSFTRGSSSREALGTKYLVGERTGLYNGSVLLPPALTCSHCVIQWQYKAGNTWGRCKNGTEGTGCGPQETFRGCSDVVII